MFIKEIKLHLLRCFIIDVSYSIERLNGLFAVEI